MHVKQEFARILYERSTDNFNKDGVGNFVSAENMRSYEQLISDIAAERNYKEGEQIMPSDLERITTLIKRMLDDMGSTMAEQRASMPPKMKGTYDPFAAMVAVNDHLYAIAMQTLGCPDIPESFGPGVTGHLSSIAELAEFTVRQEEYRKASVDRHFRDQRGKPAAVIRKNNRDGRKAILESKASVLTVAKYASEYHALKKRQEGHGAIWRFFHKKENADRENLLAGMKSVLDKVFRNTIDIDMCTPLEIADAYNKAVIRGTARATFTDGAIAKRQKMPADLLSHEVTSNERALNDKDAPDPDLQLEGEIREQIEFERGEFQVCPGGDEEIDLSARIINEVPLEKGTQVSIR